MTQRELNELFQTLIHNHDVEAGYEFQTHEINDIMTKAYREVVDELYENFEKDERVRKLLNPLVNNGSVGGFSSSPYYTNTYSVSLYNITPKVLYILTEEASFAGYSDRIPVKPITLDSYTSNKKNPFKKPYKNLVWRLDVGKNNLLDTHLVLPEDMLPGGYYITYLCQPETVDVTSSSPLKINEAVHKDIVERAVKQALLIKQTNKNLI